MIKNNKGHVLVKAICIILVIIIILPIILAFALFYDGSSKDVPITDPFDQKTFIQDSFISSMNNVKQTHKIGLEITEEDINALIKAAFSDSPYEQYIRQISVDIKGNDYDFFIGAKYSFLKTTVKLNTTLKKVVQNDDYYYSFKINGVKVGRSPNISSSLLNLASTKIDASNLEKVFADNGIHVQVDLANGEIVYKKENIINDIKNLLNKNSSNESNLLSSCLIDFISDDYLQIDFKEKISASMDLEPLSRDCGFLTKDKEERFDFENATEKVKTLYVNNIIDEMHFEDAFQYIIYGYDGSFDETIQYLQNKDLSSIDILDFENYKGIVPSSNQNLTDSLKNKITLDSILSNKLTFITEDELNEYIKSKGLIGYTYLLKSIDTENKENTCINYISIDNFYCNLFNKDDCGYLSLVAGLSFNGYETYMVFNLKNTESNNYKVTFTTDKIYLGEYDAKDELSSYLFNIVSDVFENDETIQINYEKKEIVINFEKAISSSPYKAAIDASIDAGLNMKMSISGDKLTDCGEISASLK